MTAILQNVVEALRNELQQYGEMLALLEVQQEAVSRCGPQPVLTSISAVEAQGASIESARLARETYQRQLSWALGRSELCPFAELFPLLPDSHRPLIQALVQEINQLIERVRIRAEHNHGQLRRALESMDRFIVSLSLPDRAGALAGMQEATDAGDTSRPVSAAVV
jgi:hypothetical protein